MESAVLKWLKGNVFIRKSKPISIFDIYGGFRGAVFNDCGVKHYTPPKCSYCKMDFNTAIVQMQRDLDRQRELDWYNVPFSERGNKS